MPFSYNYTFPLLVLLKITPQNYNKTLGDIFSTSGDQEGMEKGEGGVWDRGGRGGIVRVEKLKMVLTNTKKLSPCFFFQY